MANNPLGRIGAVVSNAGKGSCKSYRVTLELRSQGRVKPLASQTGKTLKPGDRRTHTFGGRGPAPGRYQLCAHVQGAGDRTRGNNESCRPLTVAAATRPGLGSAADEAGMRARSRTDGAVPRVAATSQMVAARRAKAAALRRVRTAAMSAAADSAFTERARRAAYEASRHGSDCDDSRPDVYPGATEVCDAVDNDCDGEVDEGQTILRYVDADGDLHGAPGSGMEVCPDDIRRAQEDGEWLSEVGNDCDDTDPDRWHDCN